MRAAQAELRKALGGGGGGGGDGAAMRVLHEREVQRLQLEIRRLQSSDERQTESVVSQSLQDIHGSLLLLLQAPGSGLTLLRDSGLDAPRPKTPPRPASQDMRSLSPVEPPPPAPAPASRSASDGLDPMGERGGSFGATRAPRMCPDVAAFSGRSWRRSARRSSSSVSRGARPPEREGGGARARLRVFSIAANRRHLEEHFRGAAAPSWLLRGYQSYRLLSDSCMPSPAPRRAPVARSASLPVSQPARLPSSRLYGARTSATQLFGSSPGSARDLAAG